MNNKKMYIILISVLCSIIALAFIYSFVTTHEIQSAVEAALIIIFIITFLICKNKEIVTSYGLLIFSFVVLMFDPASGYGAILIYCLICIYHKTWSKFLGLVSLILAITSIIIHKFPVSKSVVLIVTGLIAYFTVYNINNYKLNKKELILTDDEKKILDELKVVKLQKSVTCFSKNIVSKKLNEAVKRNNLSSIGELTYCYNLKSD